MHLKDYFLFLLVMAGVTYLLRAVPFVLLKGKIKSRFWRSFLAYVPYTVLAAMTVPAILYLRFSIRPTANFRARAPWWRQSSLRSLALAWWALPWSLA